jgi:alpha-tubulin N-acetyltransferase 1
VVGYIMASLPPSTSLPSGISILTTKIIEAASAEEQDALGVIVDQLGSLSAEAQGIQIPMTSIAKLTGDQHLYMMCDDTSQAKGFLKVGTKHLYYYNKKGVVTEIDPVCVLDFYVHQSCQRQGIGRRLLDTMLESEGQHIKSLAWDKPTDKSLALLRKHYNLSAFVPQPNNYVVFDDFF